jgi:hypothetical protein
LYPPPHDFQQCKSGDFWKKIRKCENDFPRLRNCDVLMMDSPIASETSMFVQEHQLHGHDEIVRFLETIKKKGLISEYLVSWNGRDGRLTPKVTVWRTDGAQPVHHVKGTIARKLFGLIPADRISIIADHAQA